MGDKLLYTYIFDTSINSMRSTQRFLDDSNQFWDLQLHEREQLQSQNIFSPHYPDMEPINSQGQYLISLSSGNSFEFESNLSSTLNEKQAHKKTDKNLQRDQAIESKNPKKKKSSPKTSSEKKNQIPADQEANFRKNYFPNTLIAAAKKFLSPRDRKIIKEIMKKQGGGTKSFKAYFAWVRCAQIKLGNVSVEKLHTEALKIAGKKNYEKYSEAFHNEMRVRIKKMMEATKLFLADQRQEAIKEAYIKETLKAQDCIDKVEFVSQLYQSGLQSQPI